MKKIISGVVVGILCLMVSGFALAKPTDDPRIQRREHNQEKRIEQGEKNGQLTPRDIMLTVFRTGS